MTWFPKTPATGGVDYENTITVAKSGGDYTTIQAAINASVSWDAIVVYPWTYTENITTKAGATTNIEGVGNMWSVIVEANSGNVLTVPSTMMSMVFLKNLKLKSTVSWANASKLVYSEGMMASYLDVVFDYNLSNWYTEKIVDLQTGSSVFMNCKFDFNGTGTAGWETSFISAIGTTKFNILQGFWDMEFEAIWSADRMRFIYDTSSWNNIIRDFESVGTASSSSYAGWVGFYMSENANEVELMGNKISLITPSWVGISRGNVVHLNGSGGGSVHLTANRVNVEWFVNNNFWMIWATETMISHFDDIVADSGIAGTGTYSYVNSPSDGDLQMSGNIIKKVIDITADYDASEDWAFGIMSATASTVDITATLNTTYFGW